MKFEKENIKFYVVFSGLTYSEEEMKSYLEDFSSLKEVERFLRDAVKLSKADATALVSRVKSIAQSESDAERSDAQAKELINQISNINQMLRS